MMNLKDLVRKNIRELEGYEPGFQPRGDDYIKLNTNENPYPPSPSVLRIMQEALTVDLRKYPDPLANEMRDVVASLHEVTRDHVLIGNGSDDILTIIVRTFLDQNDTVILTDPTYTVFEVLSVIQDAQISVIPLTNDFSLPASLFSSEAKLTFIARPNAQTGTLFEKEQLQKLIKNARGLVVIDEAYVDFARDNCIDLLKERNNVLITRSFSKSYALAGMRIGYALADPSIITEMIKVKDSYNVNRVSILAGMCALKDTDYYTKCLKKIIDERNFLFSNLKRLGLDPYPSQANFILVKTGHYPAQKLFNELKKKKILVRYFNTPRLRDCLRISIGTHKQMVILVKTIEEILNNN
ncbi:histidinol-phosphate transaminase [Chlamydiota bacterium]